MHTELVTIPTDTPQPLDGAWYEPDGGATAGTALLFHGNTMNFYVGAPRFLPPALTALGFACLAFNRRGHDILSNRNSRAVEGAAFQTTAEGIADNEIAARWVATERGSVPGASAPVIMGHSNGGFLGVQHAANHPETPALVLLSAHAGGNVQAALAPTTGLLGGARTEEFRAQAEAMVAEGRGDELMMVPGWWYVITANSYLDRLTTMPDTVATAPQIKCPTLYIRGDLEIRESYPAEDFAAASGGPCDVAIVENCDHYYNDREDAISELVAGWLKRTLIDG
ncbi:MAG: alpha/beta fold hydrolase [Proteobacteria bacterium]|nr:alpha/beta fold hydrolase [Pseudomonadota bacterium]